MYDVTVLARQVIGLMDLTSLNDDDTERNIVQLCHRALTPAGPVAAVCVYPRFVNLAAQVLDDAGAPEIKIATVTNFPAGAADIALAVAETEAAVADGANEVDVVYPYKALLSGDRTVGEALVAGVRQACGDQAVLKVILETGVLQSPELIKVAAEHAIEAGADFIKTSTGKVLVNATEAAARVMLEVISDHGGQVGFKAAGGIRTAQDAACYLALASELLGDDWISAATFRIGASSLLDDLLTVLGFNTASVDPSGY